MIHCITSVHTNFLIHHMTIGMHFPFVLRSMQGTSSILPTRNADVSVSTQFYLFILIAFPIPSWVVLSPVDAISEASSDVVLVIPRSKWELMSSVVVPV